MSIQNKNCICHTNRYTDAAKTTFISNPVTAGGLQEFSTYLTYPLKVVSQ